MYLNFDIQSARYNSCYQIDTNHFINFSYESAQVFVVNTSTWAVTTAGSELALSQNSYNSCAKIDANHFINFFGAAGLAQVFTVNTTTWAVTTAATALDFEGVSASYHSCSAIDGNHFINFWAGDGNDGYAQVFTVNTTTWAVTTANSSLEFDTGQGLWNHSCAIDGNHFLNFWRDGNGDARVQVFTVSTSTWAVTTASASLEIDADDGSHFNCVKMSDNKFVVFFAGSGQDGYSQVLSVDTSTWAVTTANSRLYFDTTIALYNSCAKVDTNHFINFWSGPGTDGFTQVFTVELAAAGPANLKTLNTNAFANIKTINTNTLANTKTYNTQT